VTPYYADDLVTIYHRDARDGLPAADVIVTDPPYGVGATSHRPASPWYGQDIAGNHSTEARDAILAGWPGPAIVFGSALGVPPAGTRWSLIWDKGGGVGLNGDNTLPWKSTYERIHLIGRPFVGGRTRESVIRVPASGFARPFHPHEKPVRLLVALIETTVGTVLDPFAGSGSTLVAAKSLGRRAIGIEIEERYCEIAATRCSQEVLGLSA
jgi:DNA modification methylase